MTTRTISWLVLIPALAALGGDATAQDAPASPTGSLELELVGNRFRPLEYAELDAAQKTMIDDVLAGPRGGLGGPFNVWLRSPEMGNRAQELGAYVRFNPNLPAALRELAIVMTARHWTSHFEWYAHKNAALEAGLDAAIVDAIAAGARPTGMQTDETAVYDFCAELLDMHRVSDATFAAAIAALGERGVVDVIGTVGYYSMVAMLLNVDEYPLPDGVDAELGPLP